MAHHNNIVQSIGQAERDLLEGAGELVDLKLGQQLQTPGAATSHVYFPIDAFISLLVSTGPKATIEVGMVGWEGMVGVEIGLGVQIAPLVALVQGQGSALCVPVDAFAAQLRQGPVLQQFVAAYIYVQLRQTAGSALCIHSHVVEARLARWLLMTHDRARSKKFFMTHEFLSYMLGVRRVGITTAAGELQRRGLIRYGRGAIEIRDVAALRRASCPCYREDKALYTQVMGI